MLKSIFQKETLPHLTDITVHPSIAENLGLKTRLSSFYQVSNESMAHGKEAPDNVRVSLHKKKPLFKGIYVDAGSEMIPDILSDLQKYCDWTKQPGLAFLNGKEYNLQPEGLSKANMGRTI